MIRHRDKHQAEKQRPTTENTMPKTILAIATAFLAVFSVFASAAEAGYCGGRGYGGPCAVGPSFGASTKSYSTKRFYGRRHLAKRKALAARQARAAAIARAKARAKAKARAAAKAAAAQRAEIAEAADAENSTISAALLDTEEIVKPTPKPKGQPKAPRNVNCKKFFPTIGMTLTVPCE
jgi:hypothetical protein